MSSRKRKRGPLVVQSSVKRPIDKIIITVNHTDAAAITDGITTLQTTTFPGTVSGLRWDLTASNFTAGAIATNLIAWAIVVVRDGLTPETISLTNGTTFYAPEQDVLASGWMEVTTTIPICTGPGICRDIGHTKTMRKLKAGDVLALIYRNDTAPLSLSFHGTVQYFYKS